MNPSPNFNYSSKEQILQTLSQTLNWIDDMQLTIGELEEKLGIVKEYNECPTFHSYNEIEKIYRDIKYRGQDPDRAQIKAAIKHNFKLICGLLWELEDQTEAVLN